MELMFRAFSDGKCVFYFTRGIGWIVLDQNIIVDRSVLKKF